MPNNNNNSGSASNYEMSTLPASANTNTNTDVEAGAPPRGDSERDVWWPGKEELFAWLRHPFPEGRLGKGRQVFEGRSQSMVRGTLRCGSDFSLKVADTFLKYVLMRWKLCVTPYGTRVFGAAPADTTPADIAPADTAPANTAPTDTARHRRRSSSHRPPNPVPPPSGRHPPAPTTDVGLSDPAPAQLSVLSVLSSQQSDHLSPFARLSYNIIVSPVLLSHISLLRQFARSYRHPALHPTNKSKSFPTLRITPPVYFSTIILPKSSLPAANKTRFQVPVEAAFNCSSSEKLFLGVVARIAETEEANELERGDRIQLEEKKGLTKIAGAEKCSL
ncbi:hypothetical protein L202_01883 [Cryptococcus amylolentus CBS 6039]|uniref:Uncharacterized protein n=1 Tax=Cryptococcus amylolentus CBS 6039 TaxID=1295533 RepID=A0A1E3I0D7_9TREE|nr:hypothetical protein L202_01883 [Cryptococcus amylolentus CBS 6039]ODN81456.1 hypothetical protein L202_01883 [Cryptococcus amylolentus CBS 6039]